jgi:hypothetical protein
MVWLFAAGSISETTVKESTAIEARILRSMMITFKNEYEITPAKLKARL